VCVSGSMSVSMFVSGVNLFCVGMTVAGRVLEQEASDEEVLVVRMKLLMYVAAMLCDMREFPRVSCMIATLRASLTCSVESVDKLLESCVRLVSLECRISS